MKIAAIIAEYNPFHFGHGYLIEQARKAGATHILAVMSGNFTQRGDCAIFDKHTRAKIALENGVDLVLELPSRRSLMSAEGFACGAVEIISSMGCADMLVFGSEGGDLSALREASGAIDFVTKTEEFDMAIKRGKSYPAALQAALREFYTADVSETISEPNNTLAIEYLNALDNIGSAIEPIAVKRLGARHDSDDAGKYISASAVRRKILEGENYSQFAPTVNAPTADISRLERPILAALRQMQPDDFDLVYDCAGGLGNRLCKAVRAGRSLGEVCFLAKTKRYTLARIRRAILCGFLGIDKKIASEKCAYVRILGMNSRGKEILGKTSGTVPIDTSLKTLAKASHAAARQAAFESRATDLYALAFENPPPCGADFTAKPVII